MHREGDIDVQIYNIYDEYGEKYYSVFIRSQLLPEKTNYISEVKLEDIGSTIDRVVGEINSEVELNRKRSLVTDRIFNFINQRQEILEKHADELEEVKDLDRKIEQQQKALEEFDKGVIDGK